MTRSVAFLRGINVGGHRVTKEQLVAPFAGLGCGDLDTFLASGNVLFTPEPGVGEGAFEFFIWQDSRQWNTFRISIFGGAGTIQTGMLNPASGTFENNFAFWEYY